MAPSRRAQPTATTSTHEIAGLSLLVLGLLLFLALISYSPRDLPSWMSTVERPNRVTQNFVGSLGAVVAGFSYIALGAASYLLAAAVLGYGVMRLFARPAASHLKPLWAIIFVVTAACLIHVLGWPLVDCAKMNIKSEGGIVGEYLGGHFFHLIFGPASILVLSFLYLVSVMMMTGLSPMAALHHFSVWSKERAAARREQEREEAVERQRLLVEQRKLEKEQRRVEKELAKQRRTAVPVPVAIDDEDDAPTAKGRRTDDEEDEDEEPAKPAREAEPERPAPKIFDSSAAVATKKEKDKKRIEVLATMSTENYLFPSLDLLDPMDTDREVTAHSELLAVQNRIIETLSEFGLTVTGGDITKGPTITRYEVYPARGVRVDRIASYERDLARATRAERINILAPIPGKDTVGIEIANSKKQKVTLRELLDSDEFQNAKGKIPIALGKDVYGHTIIADLGAMPHGLVAGTTGSGKSVCINAILASILYRFSPEDLRLIMIDPKVVEMQIYNTLPHLVVPVVTDPKKTLLALKWAVNEMEKRYAIFAKVGVRNIGGFNSRPKPRSQKELDAERAGKAPATPPPPSEPEEREESEEMVDSLEDAEVRAASSADILGKQFGEEPVMNGDSEQYGEPTGEPEDHELDRAEQAELGVNVPRDDGIMVPEKMPYIVVIVDELADLMQTAPADVELLIARITQKARAAGIHMIIATQTPRADVITGVIKANVPCRIAFQVASPLDSRVILDENGAERLLGQGDLLYRPPGTSRLVRAQGVLVTDEEVHRIVEFVSKQSDQCFESEIHEKLSANDGDEDEEVSDEDEELVEKCLEVMREERKASTSLFQRRLRLGYTRAARILDILESRGYVGPGDGAKPREILRSVD